MCDFEITELVLTDKPLRNRYYLIDYENVHQSGLKGIEKLTERDKVVVFYSATSNSIPLSILEELKSSPAEIKLNYTESGGKNALDFQLSSYMGYILGKDPDADCHIISGDKGYEYVCAFWKSKDIKIKTSLNIAGAVAPPAPAKPVRSAPKKVQQNKKVPVIKASDEFEVAVKPLSLNNADKEKLHAILIKHTSGKLSKRKQSVSNDIMRQFGNNRVKKLYKAVKPLIK